MSKTIWKFPIPYSLNSMGIQFNDVFAIEMPKDATVLTAQVQGEHAFIWAMVDPKASVERRKFAMVGTGREIPQRAEQWRYIGTFQLHEGGLVFHIFAEPSFSEAYSRGVF